MNTVNILSLIQSTITSYGLAVLGVLGAVLGVAVGYLLFRFGWHNLRHMMGGLDASKGESWSDLPRRGERYQ